MPSYQSSEGRSLEEEKRVFYVAMTRAKKRLYITGYRRNGRGFNTRPSRFIQMMRKENVVGEYETT